MKFLQQPRASYSLLVKVGAFTAIPFVIKDLPCDKVELKPFNLSGLESLHQLLTHSVQRCSPQDKHTVTQNNPHLTTLIDDIADDGHGKRWGR